MSRTLKLTNPFGEQVVETLNMTSKIVCAVLLALTATGCAVSSKANDWNGGSIPSVVIAGHDGSSERGPVVAERAPTVRDDDRGVAHRAVPLHEALVCSRCR